MKTNKNIVISITTLIILFFAVATILHISSYFLTTGWVKQFTVKNFYGKWNYVISSSIIFILFLAGFLKPKKKREWRNLGAVSAYIVALFMEMFGIPLTVYLLSSVFGAKIGFSGLAGHLWATLFARLGLLDIKTGVAVVMSISMIFISLGMIVVILGWQQIYKYPDELITWGIYKRIRHPQYLGFYFIIIGFFIQWPTVLTALMLPVLIYMYYRLAKNEDNFLEEKFGDNFMQYKNSTPMFIPKRTRIK